MRLQRLGGFTLIEVAIVVAIIAIVMTLGLGFLNSQINTNSYLVTKKRADLIKESLMNFFAAYKRFPCPHVPSGTGPVTGEEPAPPTGVCTSAFGIVPYATLGLSREIAEDGWGNFFSYFVHADTADACPATGNWASTTCFGEGKPGGLKVNEGTIDAPTIYAPSVVTAVISHGANGLGAHGIQGNRAASPTTCEEARNAYVTIPAASCSALPAISNYDLFRGGRPENDDVVAYIMANEAVQELYKRGELRAPEARVRDEIQSLYDQTIGLNLDETCTANLPATPNDPWGNPYSIQVYETPGHTDFRVCICSRGKNGLGELPSPQTCDPSPPTICKSMTNALYEGYRAKAGALACP